MKRLYPLPIASPSSTRDCLMYSYERGSEGRFQQDINSGCTVRIEETAVPCPYNFILGWDPALPSPNFRIVSSI